MRLIPAALVLCALGCGSSTGPTAIDFLVRVEDETFVMRASDPETIRLAFENMNGDVAVAP